jgi:phosphatidylinositol-3-phosphatase
MPLVVVVFKEPVRANHACPECGSPVSVDQRYCVECGRRVAPLRSQVVLALESIAHPAGTDVVQIGGAAASARGDGGAGAVARVRSRFGPDVWLPFAVPSARLMAVAVLGTLAFGSWLGGAESSLASNSANLIVNAPGGSAASQLSASVPSEGSSSTSNSSGSSGLSGSSSGSSSAGSSSGAVASTPAIASTTAGTTPTSTSTTPTTTGILPPVKHVWVIMLGQQSYSDTFASDSPDSYLHGTLAKQGELVPNYYAVAGSELANEIALISGQGPTPQTTANCPKFLAIKPGKIGAHGQVLGQGCVYPKKADTLPQQLAANHDTFKAYVQGLGTSAADACLHPKLGAADKHATATAADPYVTWRNPLVYFKGITGASNCATDDVGIPQLSTDLKSDSNTPTVSLISADPCDDGSDAACHKGAAAGTGPADKFLKSIVPKITASPAYKAGGLILITFAQAPQTGPTADSSSCCGTPSQYPNMPVTATTTTTGTTTTSGVTTTGGSTTPYNIAPTTGVTTTGGTTSPYDIAPGVTDTDTTTTPATTTGTTTTTTGTTTTGTTTTGTTTGTTTTGTTTTGTSTTPSKTSPTGGGGQVGMLAISSYVTAGSTDSLDYLDHYSVLGSIEQLFSLKRIGYAGESGVPVFSGVFYSNYSPTG